MDSIVDVGDGNVLSGYSASPGIVIGKAYRFEKTAFNAPEARIAPGDVQEELSRFERAVESSERDLRKIASVAREQLGTESAHLFEAQALMLHDPSFQAPVRKLISEELAAADFAVQSVMETHRARMESSDNSYLRERAHDMADVQLRLVRHLQKGRILSRIDDKRIVVAVNLSAADLILFTRQNLLGCVLDYGAETSHVAIMARALEIPVVAGLAGGTKEIENESLLIVDGLSGTVVVGPDDQQLARYGERKRRYDRSLAESAALAEVPAETRDGVRITLHANLEFEEELAHLQSSGAEGIGLFRTEMLFMSEPAIPSEDEQEVLYRRILERVSPRVTTFRLLDLGGDKMNASAPRERNPDLGWRGMRVLLDTPDLLMPQLRALLRASTAGQLRILLPMVTNVSELRTFKRIVDEAKSELRSKGIPFDEAIPIGVMIEIPSAAIQARHFAIEADFMSVGTNDLTQYTLAVERNNELVGYRYSSLHPAVLQLMKRTIEAGTRENKPTSICGELAGYVPAIPVLVGLGYRELSVSPISLPVVKRVIRGISHGPARKLAKTCLRAADSQDVLKAIDEWFEERPGLNLLEADDT